MTTERRLLYAHRGASAEAPENTLEAFRLGLARGANALEMDVRMTRDGTIVVIHDPDGHRVAGAPAAVAASTLAEVKKWDLGGGARVPALAEVLREIPDVPLNVDVKQREPDPIPALLDLLRRLDAAPRVRLTSFHTRTVWRLRALGYPGPLGTGRGDVLAILTGPRGLAPWFVRRGDAVQIPTRVGALRLDTAAAIERCHDLGLRVDYWVINDVDTARALLARGADGIMTDDPAAILPAFRTSSPPAPAVPGGGAPPAPPTPGS
jgi:glycerophosphoryl diester phosphodiesterase